MESTIAVKALAGVQRLALIMITGAASSCPGAALDCLLDMLPIDIYIKVVASKTAQRLRCENLWITSGNNKGHSKIVQVVHNDELDLPSDHMSKKYSFGKRFKVLIPDRKDWSGGKGHIPTGDLECYTDGSKIKNGGTGAGVHWTNGGTGICLPMGVYPTVFQAEVTAILVCAREHLNKDIRVKTINIYTDSRATLKALNSYEFNSRLVWDCLASVSELGRRNDLTLCWVPVHSGIKGNEAADRLANTASATSMIGPQPFCGISRNSACSSIASWAKEKHRKRWVDVPLLRVSKLTLFRPSKKVASDLLRLDRRRIKLTVHNWSWITGHGRFRKHLQRMGLYDGEPICRYCDRSEETADHLLFDFNELSDA
ncbi:uncharacterized protein LOC128984585 [Macrosteles quadrilineatus]|uniref:uncharacterized protein LOC128984585 n=1 Tax=Macrosteles quadrilineatus TaxID=74068 RepID=UPI0023E1100D|nr:uncharacterized protein LOC128984585 [Macrosteles quadrilineatus]